MVYVTLMQQDDKTGGLTQAYNEVDQVVWVCKHCKSVGVQALQERDGAAQLEEARVRR